MIKLAFSDLRDHAATWIGAFVVAVACGYVGGWAASFSATARMCTGSLSRNFEQVGVMVLVFSLVAAVAVLVSAANLTVAAQRRSYALWQLANVRPRLVSAVVLVQLAAVGALGAVVGTLLAALTLKALFPLAFVSRPELAQVTPQIGWELMPEVWLAVAGVFLVGGLKGARSAGRTSPMTALRGPEQARVGMTWLRGALFLGLLVGTCWLVSSIAKGGPDDAMDWALFVPLFVTAAFVPLAPAAFPFVLRAWTALVPRHWNAWYLARRAARYSLAASTSVETPIMVGFGLVAGIFSVIMCGFDYYTLQGGTHYSGIDLSTTLLMFGGPVLLTAVGAAVSVVMTARSRTRDVALLTSAGALPVTLLAAAACEALIHAVTATAMGMLAVVVSTAAVASTLGLPPLSSLAFGEGLVVSTAGFVLVLVATLAPTLAVLHRETAAVLAVG